MNTCEHTFRITKNLNPWLYPNGLEVTCGKCLACKSAKKKEWSLRAYHESLYHHNDAWYITLTYDELHLPRIEHEGNYYATLRYSDVQKFIKLLRRHYEKTFKTSPVNKIKYMCCSELGDRSLRAHYHLILFGVPNTREGAEYIARYWPHGHVKFEEVNYNTIQYVASYIDDVTYEKEFIELLDEIGIEQPGKRQSQKFGLQFALDNAEHIKQQGLRTPTGRNATIPRYYLEKIGLKEDIEWRKKCIEARNKAVEDITSYYGGHTMSADEIEAGLYGTAVINGRRVWLYNPQAALYGINQINKYKRQINRDIRAKRRKTKYVFQPTDPPPPTPNKSKA